MCKVIQYRDEELSRFYWKIEALGLVEGPIPQEIRVLQIIIQANQPGNPHVMEYKILLDRTSPKNLCRLPNGVVFSGWQPMERSIYVHECLMSDLASFERLVFQRVTKPADRFRVTSTEWHYRPAVLGDMEFWGPKLFSLTPAEH